MSGNYYSPYVQRPAILSAVGVLSIVIASISLLVDFGSLSFANVVSRFARATTPASAVTSAPSAPKPAASEYVAPQGLSSAQRQIVIEALQAMHPISDARQKQLDGLLADAGQEVIQISPDNLTADRVTAYVTDVRQMPSGSGGEPDDLFILGSGRLQISDQSAIFFSQDSPSPIRSGGGSYTDSAGQTHLASEQIAGVIGRVQTMCNHAMNDTQQNALAAELAAPAQTLITAGNSVAQAAGQVENAQMLPDGTLAVTTVNGAMSFGPSGQSYPGIVSATVAASPWGKGPVVVKRDANLMVMDGLLSFVMAGLLLASGIVLMRNSPMAWWMLVGYGIAKLLVTVLSVCAVYSIGMELGGGDSDAQSVAMAWAIILGAPGAVWAVVVLIVMSLRSAREFLSVPTGAGSF